MSVQDDDRVPEVSRETGGGGIATGPDRGVSEFEGWLRSAVGSWWSLALVSADAAGEERRL